MRALINVACSRRCRLNGVSGGRFQLLLCHRTHLRVMSATTGTGPMVSRAATFLCGSASAHLLIARRFINSSASERQDEEGGRKGGGVERAVCAVHNKRRSTSVMEYDEATDTWSCVAGSTNQCKGAPNRRSSTSRTSVTRDDEGGHRGGRKDLVDEGDDGDNGIKSLFPTLGCRNCNRMGHFAKECPHPRRAIVCHSCHEEGHLARDCPQKSRAMGQREWCASHRKLRNVNMMEYDEGDRTWRCTEYTPCRGIRR